MPLPKIIKDIYWKLPFLSAEQKETFFYEAKKIIRNEGVTAFEHGSGLAEEYIQQVLSILYINRRWYLIHDGH